VSEAPRKILHVDLDAFYAAVEQRDHPELRGKAIAVAWSEKERGVLLTASYEARPFGVRSAMPTVRALRLCPQLIIVRPNFEAYRAASRAVREIFLAHTPLVEPLSLDEAYLDVTRDATGLTTATAVAQAIRREIFAATGLTASAGAAPNKFLAKIASDWRKPDGLFVIKPHQVDAFLEPLPVKRLPGVGPATERRLKELGIDTVGDVRRFDAAELQRLFGRFGAHLARLACGVDDRAVVPNRPTKSISSETTFLHDLPFAEVETPLVEQARDAWSAVAKRHARPRSVVVKLRTADFRTRTRTMTCGEPIADEPLALELARRLLTRFADESAAQAPRKGQGARTGIGAVRLVGVGFTNFADTEAGDEGQPALFDV
jgi:DNA polymerase-4